MKDRQIRALDIIMEKEIAGKNIKKKNYPRRQRIYTSIPHDRRLFRRVLQPFTN